MTLNVMTTVGLDVYFKVGRRYFGVGHAAVKNTAEVPATDNISVFLGFPLALNAHGGIWQSLQPGERNAFATRLAEAVIALAHPLQGRLNVRQFAAFDFRQLRTDFILGRVQGGIDQVTENASAKA